MGCSSSKVDNEEPVRRCKDRRQLMKQLVRRRPELAAAHIAYLHALRNTGATLRDFAELESALSQPPPVGLAAPPSPPPEPSMTSSMPPSPRPPPPLPFSPITTIRKMEKRDDELPPPSLAFRPPGIRVRKIEKSDDELLPPPLVFSPPRIRTRKMERMDDELQGDDSVDDDDTDSCSTPLPPPPPPGVAWEYLDPYSSINFPSPFADRNYKEVASQASMDGDPWVETNLEFDGDEDESVLGKDDGLVNRVQMNPAKSRASGDENSSMVGWVTKDSDSTAVPWRSKKSLVEIVKEIDEYFLKAAASGSDVVILLDSAGGRPDISDVDAKKGAGKKSRSAKVFSTLSWSWSFKSQQANSESPILNSNDASGYGYHGKTLEKIYDEEQKLYKLVKDEEFARLEYKRHISILQKLESGEHDKLHAERVRDAIEELQTRIISLEEAVSLACFSISRLRDEELYPQIIELSAGLVHMWRNMYECHQVQNHIAQQASRLGNRPGTDPTSDTHFQATSQLEIEVSGWHNAFCNLIALQREYISILNQWIKLTDCLPDDDGLMKSSSGIRSLSEELQRSLERLPEKVAAEAIKTFIAAIHSIVVQQTEERQLKKKSDNMESKFQSQLEKHSESAMQNSAQPPNKNHSSVSKNDMKLDAFRKQVELEKARYLTSVRTSRAMTLNNLQTSLPNVFHALTGFSGVCMQAFEGISRCSEVTVSHSGAVSPAICA
ncbi:hypothetical protein HU200_036360 [Digitaria exilis]|uniref:DUF632 domain-containing protein n=1 Tax=Digitaria exilis TaxID=1010633 RepID=A0A835BGG5_9POAL|nr:hypothetical protein HU200_036360 [Digitaria exilis]CAB3477446.1 unnamed protein product [Digitaria exilis]